MKRPTPLTVFGILNIVFGVFSVFAIIGKIVMFSMPDTGNPVIRVMRESPDYTAWMKVTIPVTLISGAALLVSGIGLWRVKPWARKLSIAYAIFDIVFSLVDMVVNYHFVMRPLMEEAQGRRGPEAAGMIGGAVGGTLGSCFGMVYPILLLIFMMRPSVVAACRPATEPPPL